MVSASALAKRPERLIAATVAADVLSSDRREVVMVFLPSLHRFCGRYFCLALSIWRAGWKVNAGYRRRPGYRWRNGADEVIVLEVIWLEPCNIFGVRSLVELAEVDVGRTTGVDRAPSIFTVWRPNQLSYARHCVLI